MDWFERLTRFREVAYDVTQARLKEAMLRMINAASRGEAEGSLAAWLAGLGDVNDRDDDPAVRVRRRALVAAQLADALGISERTYRDYERAALQLSPYRLVQIAGVLGVEPGDWFVGAPTGMFEPVVPIDTGRMGGGDTRRLLRAWGAITGNPRKHLLSVALALARRVPASE